MELKEQVVSLALARRLKEMGVPQESLFSWVITFTTNYHISYTEGDKSLLPQERNDCYSAFTVAELGQLTIGKTVSFFHANFEKWACGMRDTEDHCPIFLEATEADARARMLLHLLERTDEHAR